MTPTLFWFGNKLT